MYVLEFCDMDLYKVNRAASRRKKCRNGFGNMTETKKEVTMKIWTCFWDMDIAPDSFMMGFWV